MQHCYVVALKGRWLKWVPCFVFFPHLFIVVLLAHLVCHAMYSIPGRFPAHRAPPNSWKILVGVPPDDVTEMK